MFLCDGCHNPKAHSPEERFFRSLGNCEDCGQRAVCIDCKRQYCPAPKLGEETKNGKTSSFKHH